MTQREYEKIMSECNSKLVEVDDNHVIKAQDLYEILLSHINKEYSIPEPNVVSSTKERGEWIRTRILNIIVKYIQQNGYPPTIREICDRTELSSTSSVYNHLVKMDALGMIELGSDGGSTRAIYVPGYKFVKEEEND